MEEPHGHRHHTDRRRADRRHLPDSSGGLPRTDGGTGAARRTVGGRLVIAGWFATLDGGSHRVHDLSWGVLEGVVIFVGLAASLWRPQRRPAAYQQALVGLGALLLTMGLIRETDVATLVVGAVIVAAALLHPAREQLRELGPWDRPSLIVAVLTAPPLLWYAVGQAALQRNGTPSDPHVEMAHYAGTAAVAIALAGMMALSASQRPGQRIVAASTVVGLAVLGSASLLWPELSSSFGVIGGSAALAAAAGVAVTAFRPAAGTSTGISTGTDRDI